MQTRMEEEAEDEEDWTEAEAQENMDNEGGAIRSEVGEFESDYFGAVSLGDDNDEDE